MNVGDWNILVTLAKTMNITKAAEALYISQPALSYRLRQMEKEFHISLFDRVPSGISLTPQGLRLVEYARSMLNAYRILLEDLSNMDSCTSGILQLGVCSTFANSDLPELLLAFHERYPMIQVNLHTGHSKEVYSSLSNGDVSVAILRGEWPWSEDRILLREEPVYLISYEEIDLEKLPSSPQILIPTAAIYSDSIRWWNEFFPAPPIVQMKVNNVETAIRMVEQKLGWMMVPELSLKNVDKTDRLFRMPVVYKDGSQLTRKTYILCRNSAKHLHTAAAFVDFLIDCGA